MLENPRDTKKKKLTLNLREGDAKLRRPDDGAGFGEDSSTNLERLQINRCKLTPQGVYELKKSVEGASAPSTPESVGEIAHRESPEAQAPNKMNSCSRQSIASSPDALNNACR